MNADIDAKHSVRMCVFSMSEVHAMWFLIVLVQEGIARPFCDKIP